MATTQVIKRSNSAAGAGPAVNVSAYAAFSVHAENGAQAFVGTADLEASLDGTNWTTLQALTAGMNLTQLGSLDSVFKFMRVNVTSYISGELLTFIGARLS